ncbi:MAG: HDOD domain-containing protein [bacterium]
MSSISNLPTPPLVFNQITKVVNDPSTSVAEVANIMAEDPAMSAKVLRLANSAYFGARQEITHMRQAILLLGLDAVKSLVLSSSVFDMFKKHKIDAEYQERFWRHSLATALGARLCVTSLEAFNQLDPEVAFSAGLLHDLGKLIICCFMPDEHRQILSRQTVSEYSTYEVEREVMGFSHPLVGRLLAENWKLPRAIQHAIGWHHDPCPESDEEINYAHVVHLADYLARMTFESETLKADASTALRLSVRQQVGLTNEVIEHLGQGLLDAYSRSTTFMQMALAG